jgi:hypothetical protein
MYLNSRTQQDTFNAPRFKVGGHFLFMRATTWTDTSWRPCKTCKSTSPPELSHHHPLSSDPKASATLPVSPHGTRMHHASHRYERPMHIGRRTFYTWVVSSLPRSRGAQGVNGIEWRHVTSGHDQLMFITGFLSSASIYQEPRDYTSPATQQHS